MEPYEVSYSELNFCYQARQAQQYGRALEWLIETTRELPPRNGGEPSRLVVTLGEVQRELAQDWAEGKLRLLEPNYLCFQAEMARLQGQSWPALKLYEQAVEAAKTLGRVEAEAVAHELIARFWLAEEKHAYAVLHLTEAVALFQHAGFSQKAADLEKETLRLSPSRALTSRQSLPVSRVGSLSGSPDPTSLVAAWTSLSGEISLHNLLTKLMRIVLEQSGADTAYLVFEKRGEWVIEAQGCRDATTEPTVLKSIPVIENRGRRLLPVSILEQVARRQEAVVVADIKQGGPLSQDQYFADHPVRSVLAMPFINKIKSSALLYLEQSSTTGVFTQDQVEMLTLLSSLATASIEVVILQRTLESALEKQAELNMTYSRFVPREIIEMLGKDDITQVQLGDQTQQDMTVLFSDIRSFTTLSEQMTPQENFNFINAYLGRVSPIIREHQGFIDKYIGDAVMALFPGEVDKAIAAAVAMQEEVEGYNLYRRARDYPSIKIGIGLHQGSVMLGTIGEAKRMEGTVISDAVNLASRLEGLTKLYGAPIVVSEQTLFRLEHPARYNFRFLDKVNVKGKQDKVSVFEIFDGSPDMIVELKLETRPDFEKGLFHYHNQEFREAIVCFNRVLERNPNDRAAQVYLRQATHCLWIGWERVRVLTEK